MSAEDDVLVAVEKSAEEVTRTLVEQQVAGRARLAEVCAATDPHHVELSSSAAGDPFDGVCLYPDYSADPRWTCPGDRNLDLDDFALSRSLRSDLERWARVFDGSDPEMPNDLHFRSLGG